MYVRARRIIYKYYYIFLGKIVTIARFPTLQTTWKKTWIVSNFWTFAVFAGIRFSCIEKKNITNKKYHRRIITIPFKKIILVCVIDIIFVSYVCIGKACVLAPHLGLLLVFNLCCWVIFRKILGLQISYWRRCRKLPNVIFTTCGMNYFYCHIRL